MDELLRVKSEFDKLKSEFDDIAKLANRVSYNEFGWKFLDFVISIDTTKKYDSEARDLLKSMLLVIKDFVSKLANYQEYLNSVNETSSVVDTKINEIDNKENDTNPGLGASQSLAPKSLSLAPASKIPSHAITEESKAA